MNYEPNERTGMELSLRRTLVLLNIIAASNARKQMMKRIQNAQECDARNDELRIKKA